MRFLIVFLFAVSLLTGCESAKTETAPGNTKRYDLRGKVISVDRVAKRAKIEHEEIPGFMDKMTMEFPIHEDWVWDDLQPGVEVRAELVVDSSAKDPFWLEKIGIVAAANPDLPPPEVKEPPQIGKDVPDIKLTNQDGKRFSLRDYKGKAVAVTFIYRECPLPEYCIKMSRNFSDLAIQLNTDPELKDKVRLLSISFDPARDTPEKLRQYGSGYLGNAEKPDFTVWQLAVGSDKEVRSIADFFGLQYEVDKEDQTQFNHSLVTAVVSPDGKVAKLLFGNRWTTDDLMRELEIVIDRNQS